MTYPLNPPSSFIEGGSQLANCDLVKAWQGVEGRGLDILYRGLSRPDRGLLAEIKQWNPTDAK